MPELPEVEVVKKSLSRNITNFIIKKITINNGNLRYKIKKKFFHKIIDQKVVFIARRSKYILIELDNKKTILVHLGMTGKFFFEKKKVLKKMSFYHNLKRLNKHDHFILEFHDGSRLIYNDVRRFGFIKVFDKKDIKLCNHIKILGPEPLSKKFDYKYLYQISSKRKRLNVKNLLMSQKVVSGLGNIYVNEILYFSKILPKRKSSSLSTLEIRKIVTFTKKVLKKSILYGGSSIRDFKNAEGEKGNFQQEFAVYGKKDLKCPDKKCPGTIKLSKISNRATYYCAKCQK